MVNLRYNRSSLTTALHLALRYPAGEPRFAGGNDNTILVNSTAGLQLLAQCPPLLNYPATEILRDNAAGE